MLEPKNMLESLASNEIYIAKNSLYDLNCVIYFWIIHNQIEQKSQKKA